MKQSSIAILKQVQAADDVVRDNLGQSAYYLTAPELNGDITFVGVFISLSKLQAMDGQALYEQTFGLGRCLYVVTGINCDDTVSVVAIEIKRAQGALSCGTRNVVDYITNHHREIDVPTWANITGCYPENSLYVCKVRLRGDFDTLIGENWAFREIIDELVA